MALWMKTAEGGEIIQLWFLPFLFLPSFSTLKLVSLPMVERLFFLI